MKRPWLILTLLVTILVTIACAQTNTFATLNIAQTFTALQTFTSGLTVSSGTTSTQALSATSVTVADSSCSSPSFAFAGGGGIAETGGTNLAVCLGGGVQAILINASRIGPGTNTFVYQIGVSSDVGMSRETGGGQIDFGNGTQGSKSANVAGSTFKAGVAVQTPQVTTAAGDLGLNPSSTVTNANGTLNAANMNATFTVTAPTLALSANITWTFGVGVPSGGSCTTAKGGSLYSRTDGGTTSTLYVCDNATGVWTAK